MGLILGNNQGGKSNRGNPNSPFKASGGGMKAKPTVSKEFQALKNTIEKQLVNRLCNNNNSNNKPGGASNFFGARPMSSGGMSMGGGSAGSSPAPPLMMASSLHHHPNPTGSMGGSFGVAGASSRRAGKLGSLDSLGNNINSSELSSQMSSFSTSSLEAEHQQQQQRAQLQQTTNHNNNTNPNNRKPPIMSPANGSHSPMLNGNNGQNGRPKPKLIDLEFKNELEKLFASSSSNNRAASRALSSSRLNSESPVSAGGVLMNGVIPSGASSTMIAVASKTSPNTPTSAAHIEQSASGPELIGSRRIFKSSDQILSSSSSPQNNSSFVDSGVGDTFEQKKMILDSLMQSRLARMKAAAAAAASGGTQHDTSSMVLAGSSNGLVPPPPTPTPMAAPMTASSCIMLATSASMSSVVPPAPPLPPTPPPPPPPPMPPLSSPYFQQQQQPAASTSITNISSTSEKLRQFLSQMNASSSISGFGREQQSDLLLEYKDEENSSSSQQQQQQKQKVSSMASLIEDLSSGDTSMDTLSLFNLLTNSQRMSASGSEGIGNESDENTDEKMIKLLIKLLVKSCRIFDVATQKTDTRISYWRYANPIVALVKQRNNAGKTTEAIGKPITVDADVQTEALESGNNTDYQLQVGEIEGGEVEAGGDGEEEEVGEGDNVDEESTGNDSIESENNLKTIIEAAKTKNEEEEEEEEVENEADGQTANVIKSQSRTSMLARSIIELVNESLCDDKVFHI